MSKGISLHVGLNAVDSGAYGGWNGCLEACEYDANDMSAIARKQGFRRTDVLLSDQATVAQVSEAILDASRKLKEGDIFFISYSGHGGQVPDANGDEAGSDRKDETWVLYDRMLVDDELYNLWSQFAKGVRILVVSDSCHSGSVARAMPWFLRMANMAINEKRGAPKLIPPAKARASYAALRKTYDDIQARLASGDKVPVKASVLLISGCQDNQLSYDGPRNGKFTGALRKVWNNGRFNGGYKTFHSKIASVIEDYQSPNYFRAGAVNAVFERQKPFTV